MNETLLVLLRELERFGDDNDSVISERSQRLLNITPDTGEFLAVLVAAKNAREILEIGTSNGYSTLWLASAAELVGGMVTTVEVSAYKIGLAAKNFARSGIGDRITQFEGDAGKVLAGAADESVDLLFLDSDRHEYADWWPDIRRVLRKGGLLVVDNATSHPEEVAPLIALVKADRDFRTCIATVGKGEFMATRLVNSERRGKFGAA